MSSRRYYCLVAGLREYALDGDTKGLDAVAVREEIFEQLSRPDRRVAELLYRWYDCLNLAAFARGRAVRDPLGLANPEEAMKNPAELPRHMAAAVAAYHPSAEQQQEADPDVAPTEDPFERALFAAYFADCAASKSRFIREWADFERNLRERARNLTAEQTNLLDKEHLLDRLRWEKIDELTQFDYFNGRAVMGYLLKVNLLQRWAKLDPERGRALLKQMIEKIKE